MKKLYQNTKYKKWNKTKSEKAKRNKRKVRPYIPYKQKYFLYNNNQEEYIYREPVTAPNNLCLLDNTEECVDFFQNLRNEKNISKIGKRCHVQMSLKEVTKIDYSTICILLAIIADLRSKGVDFRGNFPDDRNCKDWIMDSGLLNSMYNLDGKRFKNAEKSELLFIEKGSKKLSKEDNIRISRTVQKVMEHLTGERKHCKKLRTILLEICGNSIEWGGTKNRQWLLGIKYEEARVIFTITDVGKGILKSLNRKFKHKLKDIFEARDDEEILKGAFIKKYGSSSKKVNRNKGLPAIKNGFDIGLLIDLKVLTNRVILHYQSDSNSRVMGNSKEFNGTLYRWVVTKESLMNH